MARKGAQKGGRDHPAASEARQRFRRYFEIANAFGVEALGASDLDALLQRATEQVSRGIGVRRAKVLEYRPATDDLFVRAGVGWNDGVVRHASLSADLASPPGRAFRTCTPIYVDDLPGSEEYRYSDLLRAHGIVSLINVPIAVEGSAWGVLEVDSDEARRFYQDDEDFLAGFARVLGRAIELKRRVAADMAAHLERRILLHEREVLFRELQHRVANNLQVVSGLIEIASRRIVDAAAQQEIARIQGRVAAIVQAHNQLSIREIEKEISLGPYLAELCARIGVPPEVRIERQIGDATVPVRTAVRLGLILNELATNSLKHAFGSQGGTIRVSFAADRTNGAARLVVDDDGQGIPPEPVPGSGLALVAALAEQIGGAVSQSGEPGAGTRSIVTVPLSG